MNANRQPQRPQGQPSDRNVAAKAHDITQKATEEQRNTRVESPNVPKHAADERRRTQPIATDNKATQATEERNDKRPPAAEHRTPRPKTQQQRPTQKPTASSPTRPMSSDLKNNLKSQTPLNRKLRQQTAPSEPGTARRATKPQYFRVKKQDQKEKKKKRPSLFRRRLVITLMAYAILMPLSLFLVSLWLPHHTTTETKDFVYQLGTDKNVILKKVYSWDTVRSGDVYYLDMTGLASYCEMTTTGDSQRMRYIVKATGETVEFTLGQSVAYINGIPERTGGDVYERDGKIYVPLDFVSRCFTGLTVTLDTEKNKITIVRDTDENDKNLTIGFVYQMPEQSSAIVFHELDLAIQNQILFQNQPQSPPSDGDTSTNTDTSAP